jgi:hypothetical protein
VEIRDETLVANGGRAVIPEGPTLVFPNGFDLHGVTFSADRIQKDRSIWSAIRFKSSPPMRMGWRMSLRSSRTASRRSISALMDEKKRESVELY